VFAHQKNRAAPWVTAGNVRGAARYGAAQGGAAVDTNSTSFPVSKPSSGAYERAGVVRPRREALNSTRMHAFANLRSRDGRAGAGESMTGVHFLLGHRDGKT